MDQNLAPTSRNFRLDTSLKQRYKTLTANLIPFQTDEGLKAVYVPVTNTLDFRINAFIKVGVVHEPKGENGISHLLEHLMFRGSASYPDAFKLAAAFEALGGDWNASTAYECTEYWYQGLFKDYGEILKIFADFFMNPTFQDIDIERKIILSEIEGDTNEYGHIIDPYYHLNDLYWPTSSLAQPILGSKASLASIAVPKVRAYFEQYYNTSNTGFCLLGRKKSADRIMRDFCTNFKGFNAKGTEAKHLHLDTEFIGPTFRGIENPDSQHEVYISFRLPPRHHSDLNIIRLIVNLLTGGYCSLLMRELREKMALAYELDAELITYHDASLLVISASVSPENLHPFVKKTISLLSIFKNQGPENDDLDRAKKQITYSFGRVFEDDGILIGLISKKFTEAKETSLLEDVEEILSVSRQQIRAVAEKYFVASEASILLIGPEAESKKASCLEILMKI